MAMLIYLSRSSGSSLYSCLADQCENKEICHKVIMDQVWYPPCFHWALDTAFKVPRQILILHYFINWYSLVALST